MLTFWLFKQISHLESFHFPPANLSGIPLFGLIFISISILDLIRQRAMFAVDSQCPCILIQLTPPWTNSFYQLSDPH
jgi:hypothetical protein